MCQNIPIVSFLCQLVTLGGSFDWQTVGKYLFFEFIIRAVFLTIVLSVLAQVLGTLIGLLLYFMRRARFAPFQWLANIYIWFFRGTPLLVQILIFYSVFPYLHLVRPLQSANFFPALGYPQVELDSFVAALTALSLNEGAYMAEIVRAGIEAIDLGQMEAAKSLGMTYFLAMRRIVLPQAARTIVPPLGNEFNNMLKSSSLASVISLNELLGTSRSIGAGQFAVLELYIVASFWYLIMTSIWTFIQAQIERRLNISVYDFGPTDRGSYLSRLLGFGGRGRATVAAPGAAIDIPGAADPGKR